MSVEATSSLFGSHASSTGSGSGSTASENQPVWQKELKKPLFDINPNMIPKNAIGGGGFIN